MLHFVWAILSYLNIIRCLLAKSVFINMVICKWPLVCKESKQVLKGTCTNPHLQIWYFESLAVSGYSKSTCICRYKGWAGKELRDAISLVVRDTRLKTWRGADYEFIQKNSQKFWNCTEEFTKILKLYRRIHRNFEIILGVYLEHAHWSVLTVVIWKILLNLFKVQGKQTWPWPSSLPLPVMWEFVNTETSPLSPFSPAHWHQRWPQHLPGRLPPCGTWQGWGPRSPRPPQSASCRTSPSSRWIRYTSGFHHK